MPETAYRYDGGKFEVNADGLKAEFDQKGFIIVKSLLTEAEMTRLRGVLEAGDVIKNNCFEMDDGDDRKSKMALWNQPGNDVTGMIARSQKVAGTCEKLLGKEVYHYHTKLLMKEAATGGRFMWHQDYGYWYNNTCLFPDMMTVFVAVDHCRKSNGCLQVLEGSHLCGRIEHKPVAGQMGADPERLAMLKDRCPLRYLEMDPGDALFFHCNVLHTSSRNDSPDRRWALLFAYNSADNNPVTPIIHPGYSKLEKVPDSAILECKLAWDDDANKDYFSEAKRAAYWEKIRKDAESK